MDTAASKLQQFFESLLIFYADSDQHATNSMLSQLKSVGLNNVIALQDPDQWQQSLNNTDISPDLIIVDRDFFGKESEDKIKAIRHNKIGQNPFIPIIGTIGEAKRSDILSFMRSGIDEVLIKPFALSMILQRLNNLSRDRKPFIATMDYIGPDRRTRAERTAKKEDKIVADAPERLVNPRGVAVPNSLNLKANKKYVLSEFNTLLKKTQKKISVEILRGGIFQLIFNSVILSQGSVSNLNPEIIARHSDAISKSINLITSMIEKADLNDARLMHLPGDVNRAYRDGALKNGFDLGVSAALIDAATELALVAYQQNAPYRIIAEIRDSAQKFMTKFYRD